MIKPVTLDALKCPFCGGPVNRYEVIGVKNNWLTVFVECIGAFTFNNKGGKHHIFVIKAKVPVRTADVKP